MTQDNLVKIFTDPSQPDLLVVFDTKSNTTIIDMSNLPSALTYKILNSTEKGSEEYFNLLLKMLNDSIKSE